MGPLPPDLINELQCNKVPEYKVRNALSEQENKRVRLAQQHLQRIKEEEAQRIQEKKRKRQLQLQRQQEEKRQQELELQRKLQQQHKQKPNHIKEDDGPEL